MTEPRMPMRTGLPPVVGTAPRVLILGSFPSQTSLDTGRYYANVRNQFWRLLGSVFGFDATLPYEQRTAAVTGAGVALWDVVHSCRRAGSLDSNIDRKTLVLNDFTVFLGDHPSIERIFANGLTAHDLFGRVPGERTATRLPSSSPAATMAFENKLAAWASTALR